MIFFRVNSKALSRNPTSVEHGKQKLQNSDRTIDGTLVIDLIAVKDKVTFSWDYMRDSDLRILMVEVQNTAFCTVSYFDSSAAENTMKTITAAPDDISYAPFYNSRTASVMWKDVSISFIER